MKATDYKTEEDFIADLLNAKSGDQDAIHTIWHRMCHKQVKYKSEDWAVAYIAFTISIEKYDMDKLPTGKQHRWQFASFFSQRFRSAMQKERQKMTYCVAMTHHAWYNNQHPSEFAIGDEFV